MERLKLQDNSKYNIPRRSIIIIILEWIVRLWFYVIPLLFSLLFAQLLLEVYNPFIYWQDAIRCIFYFIVSLALGYMLSLILGIGIFGGICDTIEVSNGGPFEYGDYVIILFGKYKGRISYVYGSGQGDTYFVHLGPEEKSAFKDIFPGMQLFKIHDKKYENT